MPVNKELERPQIPRAIVNREGESFDPWSPVRLFGRFVLAGILLLIVGFGLLFVFSKHIRLPSTVELDTHFDFIFAFILIALGFLLLIVFFLLFVISLLRAVAIIKTDGYLVRYGTHSEAKVTKIGYGSDWYFNVPKIVYYSFTASDGQAYSGKWEGLCDGNLFYKLEEGDTFTVIYSPVNPKRHIPYVAAIYKAVD